MANQARHPYEALSHAVALQMFEQWKGFREFWLQTGTPPWSVLLTPADKRARFEDPTLRHEDISRAKTPEQVAQYYEDRAKLMERGK